MATSFQDRTMLHPVNTLFSNPFSANRGVYGLGCDVIEHDLREIRKNEY